VNYFPELTGIGKYSGEMAAYLAQEKNEVRVITAPPYYPEWKVAKGYSSLKYCTENINGVNITRCPIWVPNRLSGIKRICHLMSFAISSAFAMVKQLAWRPDVIFVVEPTFFCAPTALLVSRLSGAKSWLHIQDFEVDAAFELGMLSNNHARSIAMYFESWLVRRFNRVSTISTEMLKKLVLKKIPSEKCVLFPNWVDCESIYPIKDAKYFRDKLKINYENKVVLYSGNMGEKQGLEIIIEAAALLHDKNITFVLCGNGAMKKKLQSITTNMNNVIWMSLQPLNRLNDLLNLADIHLLPQRSDVADLVMPSKLTGMLASGKPVIATSDKNTQIYDIIKTCGVCTPPGDVSLFANAIEKLALDDEKLMQLGESARRFALNKLSKISILNNFNSELNELIEK